MIHVKSLTKIFNENSPQAFCALKDVSLHVKKGEISLISGVSGSGKSTLLALMAGLYRPSLGEVEIGGVSISKLPENFASKFRREKIGIIFQNFNLIPTLNVLENTLLPTLPEKQDMSKRALELLEKFEIVDKRTVLVKNLSGGEQQRVAIARSLINSPLIILADEPTANLDKALSMKLLELLEAVRQEGHVVVIATHDELLLKWSKVTSVTKLEKNTQ